jgi:hypothetical protein
VAAESPEGIYQFAGLYDALSACAEFCLGMLGQPRFETDGELNAAGSYIDNLADALRSERDLLVGKIQNFEPATAEEADLQYRLLIRFEAEGGDLDFGRLTELLRRGQATIASAS